MRFLLIITVLAALVTPAQACTSAVISGEATADGRPMLWKLRDSSAEENSLKFFDAEPFSFTGVINCSDSSLSQVWMGANEAGFAVMNTHSYNINHGQTCALRTDREGEFMKLALSRCATLADFEMLLNDSIPLWGLSANFGAIDAQGGAAYYETGFSSYVKYDVKEEPKGYLLRTNFSHSTEIDEGYGYIRYSATEQLFAANLPLTPEFVIRKASRNLMHGYTGEDLRHVKIPRKAEQVIRPYRDYVVNSGTVSVMLVRGVDPGEDPGGTLMYVIPGWPLACPAVPVWVADSRNLPEFLGTDSSGCSRLNALALEVKDRCFPDKRGNMGSYIDLKPLLDRKSGFLPRLEEVENIILKKTRELDALVLDKGSFECRPELDRFYSDTEESIDKLYKYNRGNY